MNWVLGSPRTGPGLTGPTSSHRWVLLVLAHHHHPQHGAWPSIDLIQAETQYNRKTVERSLKWLRDHGYIERRTDGHHRHHYDLNFAVENPVDSVDETTAPAEVKGRKTTQTDPQKGRKTTLGDDPHLLTELTTNCRTTIAAVAADEPVVEVVDKKQIARDIVTWYYDGVKERTGTPPVAVPFIAMVRIVERFVGVYPPPAIRGALRTMWERNRPFTAQVLEAHLQGREGRGAPPRRNPKPLATDTLAFDDDGNLIDDRRRELDRGIG